MNKKLLLIATLALSSFGCAQDNAKKLDAPSVRFWTRRTIIEVSIMNTGLATDGFYTNEVFHRYQCAGCWSKEHNPIARPFVEKGTGGIIAYQAMSSGLAITESYLLHRSRFHKFEHVPYYISIGMSVWGIQLSKQYAR